jgi:hypothetical protein
MSVRPLAAALAVQELPFRPGVGPSVASRRWSAASIHRFHEEIRMSQLARVIAGTTLIAACYLSAAPATAQTPAPNGNALALPGLSESQPNITDQKLDKAAAALERIAGLQQDFRKQVSKAVTDQGLSIDEYAEIMDVAQNDPQVRQKIMSRIAPPKGGQSNGDQSKDQSDEPTPK